IAASGNTAPRALAQSLANQLVQNVPRFSEAVTATFADQVHITAIQKVGQVEAGGSVTGVHIEHLDLGGLSDEASFNRALREPMRHLYAQGYDESMVLLIDGLDEALTYSGRTNIVRLLSRLRDLPEQARVLATTRLDPRVLKRFREARVFDLIEDAPEGQDDVRLYLQEQVDWLEGEDKEHLIERVAQAAAGSFLYGSLVLEDLRDRRATAQELEAITLPAELSGLYHRSLNRELGAHEDKWYQVYRPILGLIAVARGAGLTREQLERFTGGDRQIDLPLRVCKQYLDGDLPDGPFRPFHRSFSDFLLEDEDNPDYHVQAEDMHRGIANAYWETVRGRWLDSDEYGLRHVLFHLAGARQWKHLSEILADFDFLEAQAARVGMDDLLPALAEIVGQMGSEHPCRQQANDLLRVLDREAHNLRGWTRARHPAFFAQQVRNRAVYEGLDRVVTAADRRLAALGHPYLALAWRTYRESASLERSLVVPEFYAMAVAILPNGRVISGGTDQVLRIWDPQTGRLIASLPREHEGTIRDVAVTPDGRHAVSASFDGTLKIWDVERRQMAANLSGHAGGVRAVAVTSDGRWAVSGSDDGTLHVWDIAVALGGGQEAGGLVRVLEGHNRKIWDVAVTSDARQAVSVSEDGRLMVWDLEHGEWEDVLQLPGLEPRSVVVVPNSQRVIIGDKAGPLTLLDLDSGSAVDTLEGHDSSVFGLAVTVDGTRAVSASNDCSVRVWDLQRRSLIQTLTGHGARVYDVAVSSNGRWAISAATDGMLKVWGLERDPSVPKRPRAPAGHAATVRAIAMTDDARRAISAAQDGTLRVWDVQSGRLLHALGPADKGARHGHGIAVLPGEAHVASATEDTKLHLWDVPNGILERTITRSPGAGEPRRNVVRSLAVTPDGGRAVTAAADGRLTVWDLASGRAARTSEAHAGLVRVVVVAPHGKRAISGGVDGVLKIWDLATNALVATHSASREACIDFDVRAVAVMSNSQALVGYEDGAVAVWDLDAATIVSQWQGDGESIRAVAVMEDAGQAITACVDRSVSVLDMTTGEAVTAVVLEGSPRSIALARDDATLLVGDAFGSVYCFHYVRWGREIGDNRNYGNLPLLVRASRPDPRRRSSRSM
ncbi:MAG: hypothetical protein PVG71_07940, partial [Anaerolineae bacterium]